MNIVTTSFVAGEEIGETLGFVFGNTIRARHIGSDITASLKTIVGGEIKSYTAALTQAREEAIERLKKGAEEMGADAVVNLRFTTSQVMAGAAEILAYGTAVTLKKIKNRIK